MKCYSIFVAGLLLLLCHNLQAQSRAKVPDKFCGYWQRTSASETSWCGPVIRPDYVDFFYRIYYIDRVDTLGENEVTLFLRNNEGKEMKMQMTLVTPNEMVYVVTGRGMDRLCRMENHKGMMAVAAKDLPAVFFKKWVKDEKGTPGCEFCSPEKVLMDGKEWKIAGVRKNTRDQYEILLESDGLYKMLYPKIMGEKSMNLASELKVQPLMAAVKDVRFYRFMGNWLDKDTHEWKYGFYEDFAVYQQDFWKYEKIRFRKNKVKIELKKGEERLKWRGVFSEEDCVKVASSVYCRYEERPDYRTKECADIPDNGYRMDSVTVVGYYREGYPKTVKLVMNNILTDEQEFFYADVDSLGRFRLRVPVLNTTSSFISDDPYSLVLIPGDTLFIYRDLNRRRWFMGKNERINQEINDFENTPASRNMWNRLSISDPMPHQEFMDKQYARLQKKKDILQQYIDRHPMASETFRRYKENEFCMEYASLLMQRRFMREESLSRSYLKEVESLFGNLPRPYTLYSRMSTFVRDYLGYYNERMNGSVWVNLPSVNALEYLEKEGGIILTPQQKEDLKAYQWVVNLAIEARMHRVDSVKMAEKMKPYAEMMKRTAVLLDTPVLANFLKKEWPDLEKSVQEQKRLRRDLVAADSLPVPADLKEIVTTQIFLKKLYWSKQPVQEKTMEALYEWVKNPCMRKAVQDRQNAYIALNGQDIEYAESLKKTEHLKENKNAAALWEELTGPYKGKVIYVDFWGTWCGPCKREMKYAGQVIEAMKGEDVIFMYFANNSPKESWENVIKENRLTGPHVVHYNLPAEQQDILERRFSVRAFPTHILVDRKGKVVDMHAVSPRNTKVLIKRLKQLLKEQ